MMIDKNLSEFKLQSRYKSFFICLQMFLCFFVYKYMQRTEIIIFDKVARAKDIEKLIWFVNMYRRLYYQQNVTFDIETQTNNVRTGPIIIHYEESKWNKGK